MIKAATMIMTLFMFMFMFAHVAIASEPVTTKLSEGQRLFFTADERAALTANAKLSSATQASGSSVTSTPKAVETVQGKPEQSASLRAPDQQVLDAALQVLDKQVPVAKSLRSPALRLDGLVHSDQSVRVLISGLPCHVIAFGSGDSADSARTVAATQPVHCPHLQTLPYRLIWQHEKHELLVHQHGKRIARLKVGQQL